MCIRAGRLVQRFGIPLEARIRRLAAAARRAPQKQASTRLDNSKATILTVAHAPAATNAFDRLTWARKLVRPAAENGGRIALLIVGANSEDYAQIAEALLSGLSAASFALPSFRSKRAPRRAHTVYVLDARGGIDAAAITAEATGNNIARWLTAMPPNMLDAAGYREFIEKAAAEYAIEFEFLDEAALDSRGAGAFLAVSQGNASRDAGIAILRYKPKDPLGRIALIGKGIVFDTGGNNLKPFRGMLDMHMDMQGSGVALGLLVALKLQQVPYEVENVARHFGESNLSARIQIAGCRNCLQRHDDSGHPHRCRRQNGARRHSGAGCAIETQSDD